MGAERGGEVGREAGREGGLELGGCPVICCLLRSAAALISSQICLLSTAASYLHDVAAHLDIPTRH